jgi:hypothetical protein
LILARIQVPPHAFRSVVVNGSWSTAVGAEKLGLRVVLHANPYLAGSLAEFDTGYAPRITKSEYPLVQLYILHERITPENDPFILLPSPLGFH